MLISTTLTGNSEAVIEDALRSIVDHVDACLVIDTGVRDATINVAMRVCGPKLILRRWAWRNDFGAARNAALEFALGLDAQWAVTVDSDERLVFAPGFDLREQLTALADKNVLYARTTDRRYMKERVIHLGRGVEWVGYTHEAVNDQPAGTEAVLEEVTFDEVPKAQETCDRNFERDVPLLRQFISEHPDNARAHYYLGLAFYNHQYFAAAVLPLIRAAELHGWGERAVIAVERAMKSLWQVGQHEAAVRLVERAMAAQPGIHQYQFFLDLAQSKA